MAAHWGIILQSKNIINFLRFVSDFYQICRKMHGSSKSSTLDIFFTNVVFPFNTGNNKEILIDRILIMV